MQFHQARQPWTAAEVFTSSDIFTTSDRVFAVNTTGHAITFARFQQTACGWDDLACNYRDSLYSQ